MFVASYPAAKLVQIGQPVTVGLVDENRVGVRDVQPAFDDRGRQQHVVAAVDEAEHHLFEVVLVHLAMSHGQPGLGHDLPQPTGEDFDVFDAVVDEKYLPVAVQFAQHGVADQLGIESGHAGFDGQTVFRRRFQVRDVAQAEQAHVKRSRNRRGGHRQHVDRLPQRLQPLLHLDAEPLLLVDDHQPEVVKMHVGLGQPVRADDDVDRALFQPADDFGLLPARGESRQRGDLEGEFRHPSGERPLVLLAEQRGRHKHGHLIAGVDGLERRPHRQFRLPIAHVAAQQPIHRPRQAHVVLDRVDRGQLVGRFVVGERGVELALPFGVGGKSDAGPRRARGLQIEHVGRQIDDRLLDAILLPLPKPAAEFGQRGPALRAADVFLHQADFRGGHDRASSARGTPVPGVPRPARSSPAA